MSRETPQQAAANSVAGILLALVVLVAGIFWMARDSQHQGTLHEPLDETRSPTRTLLECMIAELEGEDRPAHCAEPSAQAANPTTMEQN
jgi:hypothetical protein